ncbi:unnamed protein product [Camellia sinensis]
MLRTLTHPTEQKQRDETKGGRRRQGDATVMDSQSLFVFLFAFAEIKEGKQQKALIWLFDFGVL